MSKNKQIDVNEPILDKIGQPITEGSIIAYGHALGRCAGIRIGKVLKAERKQELNWDDKPTGKTVVRITVMGVDDDWSHREMELTSRKGTLQFPERIIVLDPAKVPATFMTLLEQVKA